MAEETQKTIFVLEDDESFLIIFRRWLKEAGYNVVASQNIDSAKKELETGPTPSLFWIDYYLGENHENGMDFFQWLKQNPKFKDVPAIVVSITLDAAKLRGFEKQGIVKTFSKVVTNREAIIAGIKKILGD